MTMVHESVSPAARVDWFSARLRSRSYLRDCLRFWLVRRLLRRLPSRRRRLREAAAKHPSADGDAADSRFLSDPIYAPILASEYSQLEPENEMKFGPIHPEPGPV